MIAYLDTSVLLRWFLREPGYLTDFSDYKQFYSSAFTRVESRRTLHRLFLLESFSEDQYVARMSELSRFLECLFLIDLGKSILRRAEEPFPFAIGSLDAIHLSSALFVRDRAPLVFLTHDTQLAKNAAALDLRVVGVDF